MLHTASPPTVAVIIPVFGAEQSIERCIRSVLRCLPPDGELIVVDDASTDTSSEVLAQFADSPEVKVVTNPAQRGSAWSRNRGLAMAKADLVFFTDADCVVSPNWIESGLRELSQDGVIGVEGDIHYGRDNPSYRYKIPCNPFYHQTDNKAINQSGQDFSGGNIAFRRRELDAVGGYDAIHYVDGREDTDLGWRLKEKGRIVHAPAMQVTHGDVLWTFKSLLQNSRRYESDVVFLKKHGFFFFKKGRILHPQLLLMLLFPPLILKRFRVRTRKEVEFALCFYCYLVALRGHIWRGAFKSRILVI